MTSFVSEPLRPERGTFDATAMGAGAPGMPQRFFWRKRELVVSEILERWKDYGDCKHASGERYVRRHNFRLRTADGQIVRVYFQRSFGRGKASARWWLYGVEEAD